MLAVVSCAYLASTFIAADAHREGATGLMALNRRQGVVAGIVAGTVAMGGILVLERDAPELYDGLTGRALPLIAISAVAGLASLLALARHRFAAARAAAVAAVTAVVWGWGAGQYPDVLVGELTIAEAAGSRATMVAMLVSLGVGAVLFVPPLGWLLVLHERGRLSGLAESDAAA